MSLRTSAGLAVLTSLALVGTAAAGSNGGTFDGKMTNYTYTASTKSGKITVFTKKAGNVVYLVNKDTNCGVSLGQSGNSINCKEFVKGKYDSKPVHITWSRNANRKRVADVIGVDMS